MLPPQVQDVDCHKRGVAEIPESPRGGLTGRDTVGKRVFHQCPDSPRGGRTGRDAEEQIFHDVQEQVDEQVFHEDREKQITRVVPQMCIDEVTEEDMMRKLLFREGFGHGGEAGVVFHGKGDMSLPWSD